MCCGYRNVSNCKPPEVQQLHLLCSVGTPGLKQLSKGCGNLNKVNISYLIVELGLNNCVVPQNKSAKASLYQTDKVKQTAIRDRMYRTLFNYWWECKCSTLSLLLHFLFYVQETDRDSSLAGCTYMAWCIIKDNVWSTKEEVFRRREVRFLLLTACGEGSAGRDWNLSWLNSSQPQPQVDRLVTFIRSLTLTFPQVLLWGLCEVTPITRVLSNKNYHLPVLIILILYVSDTYLKQINYQQTPDLDISIVVIIRPYF